jgi:hypothetical protein
MGHSRTLAQATPLGHEGCFDSTRLGPAYGGRSGGTDAAFVLDNVLASYPRHEGAFDGHS